jgi:hypothetical protein
MDNQWLALASGADSSERADTMRRAYDEFMLSGSVSDPVRGVVAESWRRSAGLVGPESIAPVNLTDGDIEAFRRDHPLAGVMPLVRDLLGTIAYDGAHLVTVSDADGMLLWVEGHPGVVRNAESTNVVAGSLWDEVNVGTTATGIALAVDHAVQIFGPEHFSRPLQNFTCAAAPIHDPGAGTMLGSVTVSGGEHLANPHSLALVQATARAAEAELMSVRADASAVVPRLRVLGRDEGVLHVGGVRHRLSRRHSEILVLLAAYPEGLSGDRLAWELNGDRVTNPATLRAELSRLRQLLGPLLRSRPYRLTEPIRADFLSVDVLAGRGSASAALRGYAGPLLPGSQAPGIVRLRQRLDERLRDAVVRSADHDVLERWATSAAGTHDRDAWDMVVAGLPAGTERHRRAADHAASLPSDADADGDDDTGGFPQVPRQRGDS